MTECVSLTAHHLRFEVEALTPLLLPAYAGPSIRGALFGALTRHFCPALEREITVEHVLAVGDRKPDRQPRARCATPLCDRATVACPRR